LALLEVKGLHAAYGQTRVLHGLDFVLEQGSITALLGANGAGKTTTLRSLCAMVKTQGEVSFDGRRIERMFGYFPRLRERRRQQAGTLSGGEQQMLAVSRALMLAPKLMLLDEPSFGLAPLLVRELFGILRAINQREHVSMLLVEQNAAMALDLADHAYLIETGRVVLQGSSNDLKSNDSVRRSYLGY